MRELIKNYFPKEVLDGNPVFSLITWLSGVVSFIMCILSLITNMDWHIALLLFISSLVSMSFLYFGKKIRNRKLLEVMFLIIIYAVILPLAYITIGLELCEMPIYFILGIIFTVVLLEGKMRTVILFAEIGEYMASIWYVTMKMSDGIYSTSSLSVEIYIRLLLAVMTVGVAGGILLQYRNIIMLAQIADSEAQIERAEKADNENDVFVSNILQVIRTPLVKILNTTNMLFDMNTDIQRKEDIYFIDNMVRNLLGSVDAISKANKDKSVPEESKRSSINIICPDVKVLVVDDNIINLEIVKNMLQQYQCEIIGAMSGQECLDILKEEKIDIIFLDYMMPEMDGIETLRKIREAEKEVGSEQGVPVIALTADVVSGAKEKFLTAGFNNYIAKPVELKKIQSVMKMYLAKEKIIEV